MDDTADEVADPAPGIGAARSLLVKLRQFSESLDDGERVLLGQLLAPGIARAYPSEDDVVGFVAVEWAPTSVAESLVEAIEETGLRIVWERP
jgi:hypothetical protein